MVVDCHIEVGYCHTGGMPMSVHMFCLSSRRACARIHPDGRAEYRTDPMWFTDYMRRETVEWRRSDGGGVNMSALKTHLDLPATTADRASSRSAPSSISPGASITAREGVYQRAIEDGCGCRPGGGAQQRQLPLLAGRRRQAGRHLHGRRGDGDRLVPLRQVARRLVRLVGLQDHHRQGRHDGGDLPGRISCRTARSI